MENEPFIVDDRTGCVAVYRSPKVDCLGNLPEEDLAFWWTKIRASMADPRIVARRICDLLNRIEELQADNPVCPRCAKGHNSIAQGGNGLCFHCSQCGYVACAEETLATAQADRARMADEALTREGHLIAAWTERDRLAKLVARMSQATVVVDARAPEDRSHTRLQIPSDLWGEIVNEAAGRR